MYDKKGIDGDDELLKLSMRVSSTTFLFFQ